MSVIVVNWAFRQHVLACLHLCATEAVDAVIHGPWSMTEGVFAIPAVSKEDLVNAASHGPRTDSTDQWVSLLFVGGTCVCTYHAESTCCVFSVLFLFSTLSGYVWDWLEPHLVLRLLLQLGCSVQNNNSWVHVVGLIYVSARGPHSQNGRGYTKANTY